jgi:hypothetical protein
VGVQVASLSAHQKFGGKGGVDGRAGSQFLQVWGGFCRGATSLGGGSATYLKALALVANTTTDDFPHKSRVFHLNMACCSILCFFAYSFLILFRPTFSSTCAFQHRLV